MIGKKIHKFAKELWPINRSITGKGVRQTLELIKSHLPDFEIKEIPSELMYLIGRFQRNG